jgi:tetratricopeptide (TPR) repeat protein
MIGIGSIIRGNWKYVTPKLRKYFYFTMMVILLLMFNQIYINNSNHSKSLNLYYKGLEEISKKDYKKALLYFDKAIQLNEFNFDVYVKQAIVLSKLGKYEEALQVIQKASKLGQNNSKSIKTQNEIFEQMYKYTEPPV